MARRNGRDALAGLVSKRRKIEERESGLSPSEIALLSTRERQLLQMASEGMTDHKIAADLGISTATVGTYWGRIRIKFGPLGRTELVKKFVQEIDRRTIHELQATNRRLLFELSQASTALDALKTMLASLRPMLDCVPQGMLLLDGDGSIQMANERAAAMFGYEAEEMEHMPLETLVPPSLQAAHEVRRGEFTANERSGEHLNARAVRKDGTEFRIAASVQGFGEPTTKFAVCYISDAPLSRPPDGRERLAHFDRAQRSAA